MANKRIFEVINQLGLEFEESLSLLEVLPTLGIRGKENIRSVLTEEEVDRVMRYYAEKHSGGAVAPPVDVTLGVTSNSPLGGSDLGGGAPPGGVDLGGPAPGDVSAGNLSLEDSYDETTGKFSKPSSKDSKKAKADTSGMTRVQKAQLARKEREEEDARRKAAKDAKAQKQSSAKVAPAKEPRPQAKMFGGQFSYSIKLYERVVLLVKTDTKGKIVGTGRAVLPKESSYSDAYYVEDLTAAILDAAREARIPRGFNIPAVVTAGVPSSIVQRFTWPDMPQTAMLVNAQTEIASYLPAEPDLFQIGVEVVRKNKAEDGTVTLDVIVAAIPKNLATLMTTAASRAGFKVLRLDITVNSRGRLTNNYCKQEPKHYGIIDLGTRNPNVTLFLNGIYYSRNFFAGSSTTVIVNEGVAPGSPEGVETEAVNTEGLDIGHVTPVHDMDAIIGELSFILDFINYQERETQIESLLLLGDAETQRQFKEKLSAAVSVPVYMVSEWLKPGVSNMNYDDLSLYLDAYGALKPSRVVNPKFMMDLKTAVIAKMPFMYVMLRVGAALLGIAGVAAIAMIIPWQMEQAVRNEYNALDHEAQRIAAIERRVTDEEMNVLRTGMDEQTAERYALAERLRFVNTRIAQAGEFIFAFAPPAVVLDAIFYPNLNHTQLNNVDHLYTISRVEVYEDAIMFTTYIADFEQLTSWLRYFRVLPLFSSAVVGNIVIDTDIVGDYDTVPVAFELRMTRGLGER